MTTATIGVYAPNQGYIYGVQEHIDNIRYALGLARQATLEAAFAIHKAYTQLGQKNSQMRLQLNLECLREPLVST